MNLMMSRNRSKGQALTEFALTLPIIIFMILGIIDFGRYFFAYAQASNSLRDALRQAEILGIPGAGGTPPYLNCPTMHELGEKNFFTGNQSITVTHQKADGSTTYTECAVSDSDLTNNDILHIDLTATVKPFFLPFGDMSINFSGQRTIIKEITFGGSVNDSDFDGLDDTWELGNFCSIPPASVCPPTDQDEIDEILDLYSPFDDVDGDGCNNGCEEDGGTDPNDATDFPAALNTDVDGDGIENNVDNCPNHINPNQNDTDNDGLGDVCDSTPNGDTDNDGVDNNSDNCPTVPNSNQANADGDSEGDLCDFDDDNDGIPDTSDNCDFVVNPTQDDINTNGIGDVCEDGDGDGIYDNLDNCPLVSNADQADFDTDGNGDVCDDSDGDGVLDSVDTCRLVSNPGAAQQDTDKDGIGDVCDDNDGDGIFYNVDNCPYDANPGQEDSDQDGIGDACEVPDSDNDGIGDDVDNCQYDPNPGQGDADGDEVGDACDPDRDGDTVNNPVDNCPDLANETQTDTDHDGQGDACDTDDDNDGVPDASDNCPLVSNPGSPQLDSDNDGEGDACDNDLDNDGVPNNLDNCPNIANSNQLDNDADNIGNVCDPTPDGTITIVVKLWATNNGNNCNTIGTPYQSGQSVTVQKGTGSPVAPTSQSGGTYTFVVAPGTWTVKVPGSINFNSANRTPQVLQVTSGGTTTCYAPHSGTTANATMNTMNTTHTFVFGYN